MAIKTHKPTSPGKRHHISILQPDLSGNEPEKTLLRPLKKTGGRNSYGRITCRHKGGGHKRKYRVIDWKRNKDNVPAKVTSIEYDPNRSANIALLTYLDGEKTYILAPAGVKVGDTVVAGPDVDILPGNCIPMVNIPLGTIIHNIEMKIGKGAQLVRSAGAAAQLMAKEGSYVLVKLPSGVDIDGISYLPALKGKSPQRPPLFFHSPLGRPTQTGDHPASALIQGDWKIFQRHDTLQYELYNLKKDPGERTNLAKKNPAKLKEMVELLKSAKLKYHTKQYTPEKIQERIKKQLRRKKEKKN
ncbi:MAG: 50S ribosomal protein L2, partial [Desulfobulbus sp.]